MPGTAMPKQHRPPCALAALALMALAGALLALPGCSPRKPIPLDQPRLAARAPGAPPIEETPAETEAEPAPVPMKAAKTVKPAPAKPAPAQTETAAAAQTETATASPEKDAPEAAAASAPAATPAPAAQTAPAVAERQTYVQVGAFGTAMNALGAVAWLKNKGYENSRMVRVEQGQGALFRVQAGPFQDLATAHKALEVLKPDWPQAFIPLD